jgi:hypothetical protein
VTRKSVRSGGHARDATGRFELHDPEPTTAFEQTTDVPVPREPLWDPAPPQTVTVPSGAAPSWMLPAILLVAGATAASIVLVVLGFGAIEALRAALATVFVLVLPGAAVTAVGFRRASITGEQFALLAVGLSIAVVILLGLGMESAGVSITFLPWLIGIVAIVVVAAVIRIRRRGGVDRSARIGGMPRTVPAVRVTALALAGVLVVTAIVIAREAALAQPYPSFAALSMVGNGGTSLRISVTNDEPTPTSFRVTLSSGTTSLGQWSTGELAPGATWTTDAPIAVTTRSAMAALYRAEDPGSVYRRTSWVRTAAQ